jgi:hypothetical protein
MNIPIIFIHYGNSSYLPYVMKIAKKYNPKKHIIVLGDEQNAYLHSVDISHYYFRDFAYGPELEQFDSRFPFIENKSYAKKQWANFILRRWFIVNSFIKEKDISKFWTFDSDNFLLTDLEPYETQFSLHDCTSQCKGICLNGFIPSKDIVQRYINKILELLDRQDYTEHWQRRYQEKPDLFYTEMEAFNVFVKEENIDNYHISRIDGTAAFEDSITYVEDGMEMYSKKIKGRAIKKLYLYNGDIYCKQILSGMFIKMNNLNLSWMPKYIFPLLYHSIISAQRDDKFVPIDLLKAPFSYHAKFFVRGLIPAAIRDRISRGSYWV